MSMVILKTIDGGWLVPVDKKGEEDWLCPECHHKHTSCCGNSHFPCENRGTCDCDYFNSFLSDTLKEVKHGLLG